MNERSTSTEARLRSLIAANAAVVEELDLAAVLRRIAEVAVELSGAKYGALGVIGPDGLLEQFIHVGISDELAQRIGPTPEGRGVLGMIIDQQRAVRIPDLAGDPHSAGFPAHHPPMRGFLGVPVRVRGEVYGNLYLADRREGEFSAEDEELLVALAATAGIAIDNARLFEDARRRQRWSAAAAEVSAALVSEQPDDALGLLAERVTVLADADAVFVLVPTGDDAFLVEVARGTAAGAAEGAHLPRVGSLSMHAFGSGQPIVADEPSAGSFLSREHRVLDADGDSMEFGPTMAIPLVSTDTPTGVIVVTRRQGSRRFTSADLDMVADFAGQATVALELARSRMDRERLTLLEDRSRIARDLHDHVIQRLFAAGLGLQMTSGMATDPVVRDRISQEIGSLDAAIAEIRTAIFAMTSRPTERPALRHRIIDAVGESTAGLAAAPRLSFAGAVDLLVPEAMADDIVAVVREGLTNVGKHAAATTTTVSVVADEEHVTVEITDDGVGIPSGASRASGTANLRDRAESWGGACEIAPAEPRGTRLTWRAPLPREGGGQ